MSEFPNPPIISSVVSRADCPNAGIDMERCDKTPPFMSGVNRLYCYCTPITFDNIPEDGKVEKVICKGNLKIKYYSTVDHSRAHAVLLLPSCCIPCYEKVVILMNQDDKSKAESPILRGVSPGLESVKSIKTSYPNKYCIDDWVPILSASSNSENYMSFRNKDDDSSKLISLCVNLDAKVLTSEDIKILNIWSCNIVNKRHNYVTECPPCNKYEHIGLYPKNTFHWNALLLIIRNMCYVNNAYSILMFYCIIKKLYQINLCDKALKSLLNLEPIGEDEPCVCGCLTNISRIICDTTEDKYLSEIGRCCKFITYINLYNTLIPKLILENTNFDKVGKFMIRTGYNIEGVVFNYYTRGGFVRHPYYGAWFNTQSNMYKILYTNIPNINTLSVSHPSVNNGHQLISKLLTVETVNHIALERIDMIGVKIASLISKSETDNICEKINSFVIEHYGENVAKSRTNEGNSYSWRSNSIREAIRATLNKRRKTLTLSELTGNPEYKLIPVSCMDYNKSDNNYLSLEYSCLKLFPQYEKAWLLYIFRVINRIPIYAKFEMIPELGDFLLQSNIVYNERLPLAYTISSIYNSKYNDMLINASNEYTIVCMGNIYSRCNITRCDISNINRILMSVGLKSVTNLYIIKFIINCITDNPIAYSLHTVKSLTKLYVSVMDAFINLERTVQWDGIVLDIVM